MRVKFLLRDRLAEQYDELEQRIIEKRASKRDIAAYNVIVSMTRVLR